MTLADRLQAARSTAAVGPVEERAVLRLAGRDVLPYLHRICTQDVNRLRPGEAVSAAFLDAKGHLVADALLHLGPADVHLLAAREAGPELLAHVRRFVIRDDVKVEDRSAALRCLPVLGPAGVERARALPGAGLAVADARRGAPAVDLLLPAGEAGAAREGLVAAGAVALSADDLESLRVLAGIPRFGAELDRSRLAIETDLPGVAISFEKGCYIGQEVVLRGTFRGQVQRGLVQLALPPSAGAGTKLLAGALEVGVVTSAAETPEGRLGLGYLKRSQWRPGAKLAAGEGEAELRRVLVFERERESGRG